MHTAQIQKGSAIDVPDISIDMLIDAPLAAGGRRVGRSYRHRCGN